MRGGRAPQPCCEVGVAEDKRLETQRGGRDLAGAQKPAGGFHESLGAYFTRGLADAPKQAVDRQDVLGRLDLGDDQRADPRPNVLH